MVEKAGFWRRALAFCLDALLVAIALELVAVVAFPLSDGRIQASIGIQTSTCQKFATPPPNFDVPPDLQPNFARHCRVSFFGLPTARTTTIGRETRDGHVTKTVSLGFMVNEKGDPIRGFSLNLLFLPLMVLLRWWTDQIKASPGRRVCKVRVTRAIDPGDTPPPRAAFARRYAAFALPFLPAWLFDIVQETFPSLTSFESTAFMAVWIGTSLIAGIAVLWAIGEIVRREDTFYDRFAGTVTRRFEGFSKEPGSGP